MKNKKIIYAILFIIVLAIFYKQDLFNNTYATNYYNIDSIPEYSNEDYVIINNNEPDFSEEYKTTTSFEIYDELDNLGRAVNAFALVSLDTMPDGERESIASIKPTGWHTIKYDNINGKYLYNRCHLIGWQLTNENANKKNLITCTRQMNVGVMLDKENEVADYIKKTGNHVLYQVTPVYKDDNLVASGVLMKALSIEDNGKGIKFNIFVYNVQEGIKIDYKTGESKMK